jgi:lipopolysaccharide biosynthesis glycosyltransferase
MIRLFVGFDQREAVAFHTFCQSVIETTSMPVAITPLALPNLAGYRETHSDGSNAFIYSRFLTPYLSGFQGWAIFADGDMICRSDLAGLWQLRDERYALQVVKHDYKTKAPVKYLGNKNENYPRKNWSSLMLIQCGHPKHRILTPEFLQGQSGKFLHRFEWLADEDIGELPMSWNWLTTEYDDRPDADLLHYTLGTPCFRDYADAPMAEVWHSVHGRSQDGMGV